MPQVEQQELEEGFQVNRALGVQYAFKTSGLRKPCFGRPQTPVEAIRQGEFAPYIDWLRVLAPARFD